MPQPPHGHVLHRHMRTIHEVRTLVTRVITDVYYVDGTEVERKVTEVTHTLSLWDTFLLVEKLPWHVTSISPTPLPCAASYGHFVFLHLFNKERCVRTGLETKSPEFCVFFQSWVCCLTFWPLV